jgi:hypothetical protein
MPIGVLGLVLIQIGISILSRLLAPRVPRPRAQPFQSPTTEIGAQLPRGFGIYQTSGVITLVREKRAEQSDDTSYTLYYAKIQMVCGFGPVHMLYDIIFDEKAITLQKANKDQSLDGAEPQVIIFRPPINFASSVNPITFTIAARQMFGGTHQEGGVQGELRVYPGTPNQAIDPLVEEALGDYASRYPNLVHAVFGTATTEETDSGMEDQWYWGANLPNVRPVSFLFGYYPNNLLGGFTGKIGLDANWVEVIFDCLTNPVWGKKEPVEKIDVAQFIVKAQEAVDEGMGLSDTLVDRSLDDFIDDILSHVDGALVTDPITGLLQIKTARADYVVDDLDEIDEENSSDFRQGEAQYTDALTEIKVKYRRFLSSYAEPVVGEELTGDLKFSGGSIYTTFQVNGRNISDVHVYAEGTDPVTAQVELTLGTDYTVSAEKGIITIFNTDATTTHQIITADYIPAPTFSGFVDDVATTQSLALRQITGRMKSETFDYPMYTTEIAAQRKADLLRKTMMRKLRVFQWKMGRDGALKTVLDVVKINGYGLTDFAVRITKVTIGTLEDPEVTLEAVEDVFGEALSTTLPTGSGIELPGPDGEPIPPLAAIYCIDEDELGVQASDVTYNIEVEEADDLVGTGAVVITVVGGVPGDTTSIAITIGKTHRARQRRGTSVGVWTDWIAACPTGVDPGCVEPTVEDVSSVSPELGLGTLSSFVTDPQLRFVDLAYRLTTPDGLVGTWETATEPYSASVAIVAGLTSYIARRERHYDCSGNLVERIVSFPFTAPETHPGDQGGGGVLIDIDLMATAHEKLFKLLPAASTDLFLRSRKPITLTDCTHILIKGYCGNTPAAGLRIALKYTTDFAGVHDGSAEWRYMDGASGPFFELIEPGPFISVPVSLEAGARAVVVIGAWSENGDDVTDLVLGGVAAEADATPDDPGGTGEPPICTDDNDPVCLPNESQILAWFVGDRGKEFDVNAGTGDGELLYEWFLDYTSDADAVADGWTVVKNGGGSISYPTSDTDGNTNVPQFTVVNDGNAYYTRTFTTIPGHTYNLKGRGRNKSDSGFDTGSRLEWEPGSDAHFQSAAWVEKTVNEGAGTGETSMTIIIGRRGGYFGIAGTYWCRASVIRVYGASDATGADFIRWRDQTEHAFHLECSPSARPAPDFGGDDTYVDTQGGKFFDVPDALMEALQEGGGEVFAVVRASDDPGLGGADGTLWAGMGDSGSPSEYPDGTGHILDDIGSDTQQDVGDPVNPNDDTDLDLTQNRLYMVRFTKQDWTAWVNGLVSVEQVTNVLSVPASGGTIGGSVAFKELIFTLPLTPTTRGIIQDALNCRYNLGFPYVTSNTDPCDPGGEPCPDDEGSGDPCGGGGPGGGGEPPVPREQGARIAITYNSHLNADGDLVTHSRGTVFPFESIDSDVLDNLRAQNGKVIVNPAGLMKFWGPDRRLSVTAYKNWFVPLARSKRSMLADYPDVLAGAMMLDDLRSRHVFPGGDVTMQQVDDVAELWATELPLGDSFIRYVRETPADLKDYAFKFLQGAVAQYTVRFNVRYGSLANFIQANLAAAIRFKLRMLWGLGITYGDGSGRVTDGTPITAAHIVSWGNQLAQIHYSDGLEFWRHDTADWVYQGPALETVYDTLDATP